MDLDFTEEQQMLRETVRGLCDQLAPFPVVRKMEDDPVGYPSELWKEMGALGLIGLTLPEEHGGSGLTALEAAIMYEELGRALTPSPHFVSAVMSAGALLRAGSDEHQRTWLPQIATGEAILTPAWLEPGGGFGPKGVQVRATPDGNGVRLRGAKRHVLFAGPATRLLVLARMGDGERDIDLFLVDPNDPGVQLTQQRTISGDTQYRVDLTDVHVPASDRIGAAGSGWTTWDDVMHDGIILLAAQAVGGAQRSLEITVEYAKTRHQFDKPLGAFQAIAHYLADASTTVDGGTTLVYEAAWARANGKPVGRLAPMAKLFACQAYRDVTAMSLQVHGGIGFSIECDAQLFFRRAKHLQMMWWDSRYLEELIASDVLDAGAA
jgi:alkylation response protein AidB-like acyl-CoA dehydrogenase